MVIPETFTELMRAVHTLLGKQPGDVYAYFSHKIFNPNIEYVVDQQLNIQELERIVIEELDYLDLNLTFDIPFPPHSEPNFRFIDLFAGIGGLRMPFQEMGGNCVYSSEWNKYSQITYSANYGEVPFGDITTVAEENIPDHDLLIGGFPCQPFSIAGVSKKNALGRHHGFLDKLQGNLFFDIVRILDVKRPRMFLLENVKNLRSHDKKRTYKTIRETLERLEYQVFDKVIDARYYVSQHRERIFIVGFDTRIYGGNVQFNFPALETEETPPIHRFVDILEETVDPKYTLTDNLWRYLQDYAEKHRLKGNGFGFGMTNLEGVSRTLSARYYKDGSEILIPQVPCSNPRRLTPLECKRLMGFPDNYIIQNIGVSDMQLYKQFGNAVVVPVVRDVAQHIVPYLQ